MELADQDGEPEQHRAEQDAQPHLGVLRPADPRRAERGDGIRDRLHPGQRGAAGRERLQQQQQADRLRHLRQVVRHRDDRVRPDQAADDDGGDRHHENDRRHDEQPG
jgi:hypothetical protein